MSDLKQIIDYFGGLGGTAVIVLVSYALWTGRLILPRERDSLVTQLEEAKKEGQKWEAIALRGMKIAEMSTSVAQQSATPTPSANPDPRAT